MIFQLDSDQTRKLHAWLDEQNAKLAAQQEQDPEIAEFVVTTADGKKLPYLGAIGGGCTYQFTPTGLGIVTSVTFCKGTPFEAMIDLTDYDSW